MEVRTMSNPTTLTMTRRNVYGRTQWVVVDDSARAGVFLTDDTTPVVDPTTSVNGTEVRNVTRSEVRALVARYVKLGYRMIDAADSSHPGHADLSGYAREARRVMLGDSE